PPTENAGRRCASRATSAGRSGTSASASGAARESRRPRCRSTRTRPDGCGGSWARRPWLGGGRLGAPQLDGELEDDVLVDGREVLDLADSAPPEPLADAHDEALRSRRARRQPDDLRPVQPGLVDLGLVLDQVRLDAARARDLDPA